MYNVTIIGAGRSGRGMLGELFHRERGCYQVTFVDCDSRLVEGLREQGYYHVTMNDLKKQTAETVKIDGFQLIDAWKQPDAYHESVARADIVLTALLPDAFEDVMDHLSAAIRLRMRLGLETVLPITLGANYVGLYEAYDHGLRSRLNAEETVYFEKHILLVMSIVNRKNLLPETNECLDRYHITGDNKSVLRVEDLPALHKISACPFFFRFEKDLSAAMAIKIWAGNLVQCSMAFVALYYGLDNTYDAAYHPTAARFAYYAAQEGYFGVAREYGLHEDPVERARNQICIFRNESFRDSLHRIAREPLRKMGRNDRFIGPALLCLKYGRTPYFIAKCCAYGFFYRAADDPQSLRMGEEIAYDGIDAVILRYTGLNTAVPEERLLFDLIRNAYYAVDNTELF